MKLTIDEEFKTLLMPLAQEERDTLEASIIKHGCRDPLTVWVDTIVDGHNRYEICTARGIKFNVRKMEFADREAAMDWMDENQLGRRNLKPMQFKILIGRRYERTKKPPGNPSGANQHTEEIGQNARNPNTAETIAKQHGVDPRSVRRAGKLVKALAVLGIESEVKSGKIKAAAKKIIDTAESAIPELADMMRIGEIDFKTCAAVARLPKERQKKAVAGGVFGVNNAAKGDDEKPDVPVEKVKGYIPAIGKDIATLATRNLDKVLDCDKFFNEAMDTVIAYCEKRKQNHKTNKK